MNDIYKYSNPQQVYKNAIKYFNGHHFILNISDKPNKKYMILNPNTNKYVYFGQIGYIDYTFSHDENKRYLYLKRSSAIPGNWKDNKYSPNNLSRYLLWNL